MLTLDDELLLEVEQLDTLRVHVTMDDALAMQLVQGLSNFAESVKHLFLDTKSSLAERLPCSIALLSIQVDELRLLYRFLE